MFEKNQLEDRINELEKELSFYKSALNSLPNPIFVKNEDAEFVFFNKAYDGFFGVDSREILGTTVETSKHLNEKDKFRYHVEDTYLLETQGTVNYDVPFIVKDQETIPSLYWSCGFKTDDEQKGLIGEIVGVTNLKNVEKSFLVSLATSEDTVDSNIKRIHEQIKQFFRTILNFYDARKILIFEIDYKNSVIQNLASLSKSKYKFQEKSLISDIKISDMKSFLSKFTPNMAKYIQAKNYHDYNEIESHYLDIFHSIIYAPLYSENDELLGLVVVTEPTMNTDRLHIMQSTIPFFLDDLIKSRAYEKIGHIQYIDKLTNIFNRNKYTQTITQMKANKQTNIGILVADINGLSTINEFYGDNSGDVVLIKSANMLKNIFGDTVYRSGDDEFVILYPNIEQCVFEKLIKRLKEVIKDNEFCNISFGYVFLDTADDITQKIVYATELMNLEKQSYYSKLSDKQTKVAKYSHSITQNLLTELKNGMFTIYLQPQIDLDDEMLIGAEALIRKFDQDGNIIPPIEFLPHYENQKIIRHVDLFVIEKACGLISKWKKIGREIKIAVNLSRVTLMERGIIEEISEICDKNNVPHRLLELELTETSNSIENSHLKDVLKEAVCAGFSMSLDDFGAEYSNLQVLTSMDFTQIKFDKSLIDNICSDIKSATIIEYAIKMCNNLSIGDLLAEGIETFEQKEALKLINCKYGQGYFFSKPLPIDEFENKYFKDDL